MSKTLREYIEAVQAEEKALDQLCYTRASIQPPPIERDHPVIATISKTEESTDLMTLIDARNKAKEAEEKAAAKRRALDIQIANLVRPETVEGSTTAKVGDYKVSVTYAFNRRVDSDAVKDNFDKLPLSVQALFRWKAEVDLAAYREADSTTRALASTYITETPARPTVRIA